MVYNPRIGPDGAFVREFTELKKDVKHLGTRPSGNIVIQETLTTTDPVTGVKTVFGQLPDGSFGIQPFIYDITPPPVATTPIISSEPGMITVSWDGLFVGGAVQPKDFIGLNVVGHKMVNGATASSKVVGQIRVAVNKSFISTNIMPVGETWQFSFESEDYNGNLSARSARTLTVEMKSLATDAAVSSGLAAVQADADAADLKATNAQTSANNAQSAADAAATTANSKGKTIIQSAAPAVADQLAQNLWIDTTGGANTPKRWSGTAWVTVTDKVATDAANAAAAAQTKADQAFNDAAAASTAAGNAQTTADGKNRVWYQTTAPAGTGHKNGDQWFDTDDGNKLYLWTGTSWVAFQDAAIATAQSTADTAQTSANGKNKIYRQTTMPTGGTYIAGDTWFDTDDDNKIYVHNGTTFVASALGNNALVANLDAGKMTTGTLDAARIDAGTIGAEKLLVSNSTNVLPDPSFSITNITNARFTASTGGTAGWTVNAGTATGLRYVRRTTTTTNDIFNFSPFTNGFGNEAKAVQVEAGQRWLLSVDVETGVSAGVRFNVYQYFADGSTSYVSASAYSTAIGRRNLSYVWTVPAGVIAFYPSVACNTSGVLWTVYGNGFVGQQAKATLIENGAITTSHMTAGTIDASVITAGTITAPKIAAKTITTDKLVITSTNNLIVEADFSNNGSSWQLDANRTINATAGRGELPAFRVTGTIVSQTSLNLVNKVPVGAEDRFRASMWVKSSTAAAAAKFNLKARAYTTATAFTNITLASNASMVAATWTNVSGISPVLPAGTIALEFFLEVNNDTTAQIVDIDYVSVTRAADGALVVDGAITATKLETTLVLASTIVAGASNGTHAEMSPSGFKVFAADPLDGIPNEVVRLGVASTDDYFAITRADGSLAASINQNGGISSPTITVSNSLTYKGREMSSYYDALPRGIVSWAQFSGSQLPQTINNGSEIGLVEIAWVPDISRMYAVHCTPILATPNVGASLILTARYTTDGTVPTITSPILAQDIKVVHTGSLTISVGIHNRLVRGANGSHIRVLYTLTAAAGGNFTMHTNQNPTFWVEDIGSDSDPNGVLSTGGGTNVSPVATYTTYFTAGDNRNYDGSGNLYTNGNHSQMYQGQSPAGYGKLKSMAFFGDMTATLSGATINDIQVYFNFSHWYNNAGGTALIGLHGHTGSPPATFTFAGAGEIIQSSGWPKPGARWVSVPSVYWNGFKTGAYRGLVLGGGASDNGSYEYYGIADENPQIYIKYTK